MQALKYVNVLGLGLGAPLVVKDQQHGISWEQVRNAESQALAPAPRGRPPTPRPPPGGRPPDHPPTPPHTRRPAPPLAGKSPFEQKALGKFSCTLTCEKH